MNNLLSKISINKDASLKEALEVMSKNEISAIAVVDDDKLVGILSTRDFLKKFISAQYMNEEESNVSSYMTQNPQTIEHFDFNLLINLFTEGKHHYYPVVQNGTFQGMIYRKSIIKELLLWKKTTWFKP